jgi:hypothetical protein
MRMDSVPDLLTGWREVQEHDRRRFEVRDPIAFADGGPDGRDWSGGPWAAEGRLYRAARISRVGGGTRELAVLDPLVHASYRALVGRMAPAIERVLGPSVVVGRCLRRRHGLVLEPWRRAWRRHRRAVADLSRACAPALRMDVRDFFGSIEGDPLCEAVRRAGAEREDVATLRIMLRRFAACGIRGLPVGPEPSAVLANLALTEADRALARLGLPFVRWCDDVTVGLARTAPAEAMEAWADALRRADLRPAPEKTRLVLPEDEVVASWDFRACPSSAWERGGRAQPSPSPSETRAAAPFDGAETPSGLFAPPASLSHALSAAPVRVLLDRAAALRDEPDPHAARGIVAGLASAGGRDARLALRHVLRRFPDHASVARWGLSR